jgi:hypothetical protein
MRATVSWPVILVNMGERIFTLRPETAGAEASRRNWIFNCRSFVRREGEEVVEGVLDQPSGVHAGVKSAGTGGRPPRKRWGEQGDFPETPNEAR